MREKLISTHARAKGKPSTVASASMASATSRREVIGPGRRLRLVELAAKWRNGHAGGEQTDTHENHGVEGSPRQHRRQGARHDGKRDPRGRTEAAPLIGLSGPGRRAGRDQRLDSPVSEAEHQALDQTPVFSVHATPSLAYRNKRADLKMPHIYLQLPDGRFGPVDTGVSRHQGI